MNPEMTAYAVDQASFRARLLRATAGFWANDMEDARQELLFDCVRRSPKFNPRRGGWNGFVRGVMQNQSTVLVRRKRRIQEIPICDLLKPDCENPDDFLDSIANGAVNQDLDCSLDVQRVLKRLPDPLRKLAYLLPQMRVNEICMAMGKSRSRVYQMIAQIRTAFVEAGLGPGAGGCD